MIALLLMLKLKNYINLPNVGDGRVYLVIHAQLKAKFLILDLILFLVQLVPSCVSLEIS